MARKGGIHIGHGGKDPGAVGRVFGLQEKVVTLGVGLKVLAGLKPHFEMYADRTTDQFLSLGYRSDYFNRVVGKDGFLVGIHTNSNTNVKANYVRAYVYLGQKNKEAGKLGAAIVKRLMEATGWSNGGMDVQEADHHMTRETSMAAVIIEMGFISNAVQEKQMTDSNFKAKLADAITKGVLDHHGITQHVKCALPESIATLVREDILNSPEYWQKNAVKGGQCDGEYVGLLIERAAKKFKR